MSGESFIESEIAAQLVRNGRLLEIIEQHGASLNDLRPIDFFFYTTSAEDGVALSNDLAAQGFQVRGTSEASDGKWSVQATREMSVQAATSEQFVEQLIRQAAKYLAEFDGWGTPI